MQEPLENRPARFAAPAGIALPMVVSQASDTIMMFTDRLFPPAWGRHISRRP
jgi:hypothetical protein